MQENRPTSLAFPRKARNSQFYITFSKFQLLITNKNIIQYHMNQIDLYDNIFQINRKIPRDTQTTQTDKKNGNSGKWR